MADNNLNCFALVNLDALSNVRGLGGGAVNFHALVDLSAQPSYADCTGTYDKPTVGGVPIWEGARLLTATPDGSLNATTSADDIDLADPLVLSSFIAQGIASYPAEHYMLLLWDHGAGWMGFGEDSSSEGILSPATVASAIADGLEPSGSKLDLIGFDACLMANYEAAAAFCPYASFMVASQELEPGTGWDYTVFQRLVDDPSLTPDALGVAIADTFIAYSLTTGASLLTLSVINCTAFEQKLQPAFEKFAAQLGDGLDSAAVVVDTGSNRGKTQEMVEVSTRSADQYSMIDAGQFFAYFVEEYNPIVTGRSTLSQTTSDLLGDAASQLLEAYSETITHNALDAVAASVQETGMTLYFPTTAKKYDTDYDASFGNDTWTGTLMQFYESSQLLAKVEKNLLAWSSPVSQLVSVTTVNDSTQTMYVTTTPLINAIKASYVQTDALVDGLYGDPYVASITYETIPKDGNVTSTWDGVLYNMTNGASSFPTTVFQTIFYSGSDVMTALTADVAYTEDGSEDYVWGFLQQLYNHTSQQLFAPLIYTISEDAVSQLDPSNGGFLQSVYYTADNEPVLSSEEFPPLPTPTLLASRLVNLGLDCSNVAIRQIAFDWADRAIVATTDGAAGCINLLASQPPPPGPSPGPAPAPAPASPTTPPPPESLTLVPPPAAAGGDATGSPPPSSAPPPPSAAYGNAARLPRAAVVVLALVAVVVPLLA